MFQKILFLIKYYGVFCFSMSIYKFHIYFRLFSPDLILEDFVFLELNILWGAKWILQFRKSTLVNKLLEK